MRCCTVDANGNLLTTVDALGKTTTNTYSPNGLLATTKDPLGNVTSFGYDGSGNLTSQTDTMGTVTTYTYDNNGNTATKVDSTGTTQYFWDFENRMSSVTLPGSGGTVSFKYDPFGRRIEKSSSSGTSIYAYDDKNLIEEVNSAGSVVARYTQGENIDEPLAMLRSGATSYYEQDDLSSVTSLSNGAGSLAQTYTFDSFGNQTASSGSLTNPFRFAGREFDTELSLYFMRARYFDPATGRFISEDPYDAGSLYDDLNRYVYTENNPTNWTDPLGLYTLKKGGKHPPLPPSPEIDKLLNCIESKTGLNLTVTSTSEDIPQHPPGTPHRRGVAVDLKYDPGNADKVLCVAAGCGAGFGLDEAKHPSAQSTGNHIHLQIPAGKKGGHGDLPKNTCSGNGCKP